MAFSEVVSLDADVTIAIGKKDKKTGKAYPKSAEGYYLGTRTVQNKRGEGQIHFLKTSAGNLGVWGTTDLNRKLLQVPAGTMVRITSTGTKPTPNGDMYTYRVEQDTTNVIEVQVSAATPSYADEAADLEETETPAYESEDNDEDVAQSAALAAAERKAAVEALLKGAKSKSKN